MRRQFREKIAVNFIVIAVCLATSQSLAFEFAGGTGEPNDPYQIATAEQLQAIGVETLNDKCFVLVADIDLDPNLPGNEIITDRPFIPSFSGTLDGNGHSISNMVININNSRRAALGLIGYIERDGIVTNIEFRNIKILGVGDDIGALAGVNYGKIFQSSVTGSITGVSSIGGLVGSNGGDIVSCYAFCTVQSQSIQGEYTEYTGGMVGVNGGYISNCYTIGAVTGKESVGGLVGLHAGIGCISNCYAIGAVTGNKIVGGLIGYNYGNAVSQCYAACEVIADSNDSIGGLIGRSGGQTTDSFWDIQVSGQKISAGGIGLSTAKLQDSGTYLNAGWDMTGETSNGVADIWTITEPNTYPQLTRFTDQYSITQLPGSGTADDPYKIATAEDLVAINDYDINAHYVLVADIDMSGMVWATAPISTFNGTFDGRGHTISNINIEGSAYLGLFGTILTNGVVTNLTIQDAYIIGYRYVGALAGMSMGHITNCHVTGSVTGDSVVGGLVGLVGIPCFAALEDYVSDCSADVILSGNNAVNNIANVDFDC